MRAGRTRLWACTTALAALFASVLTPVAAHAATPVDSAAIEVLSGRADSVSGGDALIGVVGAPEGARITAAGKDVTDAFAPLGDRLVGEVDGLPVGVSEVAVTSPEGAEIAALEVENHPITGPVFSGPQHPMYCTASGAPWNLGPVDENCHIASSVVSYRYRTTGGQFANYPTDGSTPADVATTTTIEGATVPYVVRIERGTINRAVYETAVLHQPSEPAPTPFASPAGWNGRLAYAFGGGCGVGYWQGSSTAGVQNDLLLSRGYAVASATFNVFGQNCNDVTSAETAMMVKEHVVEQLGSVRYTIGWGRSAGTMQQLLLSNNYPGILDGVLGEIGYVDERSTTVTGHDCRGPLNYWNSPAGAGWTDAQKLAVTGQAALRTCEGFARFASVDDPNTGCNAAIPVADRWSPSNPEGLRCTIADMVKNVYGTDDQGRGLRVEPDNVGVQYGLNALQNGVITPEQFLSLNENIGGIDVDGNRTAERSVASVEAIERAFATGRVNMMTGGLESIPVIEIRNYTDLRGDFHDRVRSAIMRERMLEAWGDAGTHASWTGPDNPAALAAMQIQALTQLEAWLDAIMEAGGIGDRERTIAARPAGLSDGCFDAQGSFISEVLDYGDPSTVCNTLYPFHSQPRAEAGMPLTAEVLKCELTAPARDDYPEMTDDEWNRLTTVFASGVCDYTQPSQGFTALKGTWLDFGVTKAAALDGVAISGTARIGSELTASGGSSTPDATLSYQWFADGVPIEGAIGSTLAIGPEVADAALTVRVTASAPGFVDRSVVSEPTLRVLLAASPTIEGTPVIGETLRALPGEWSEGATLSYQWYAGDRPIRGQNKATLKLTVVHLNQPISVEVAGTLDGYESVTLRSEPTLRTALAAEGLVIGVPFVGTRVTAVAGLWTPGTSLSYQWLRDGEPIAGATGRQYTLSRDDRGSRISVAITGAKDGYPTVTLESRNAIRLR